MTDIPVFSSLLFLITVICVGNLEIINHALLDRRFHFRLVLLDGGQWEFETDLGLHASSVSHVRHQFALGRIEELHGQWRVPVQSKFDVEVRLRLPNVFLFKFKFLHLSCWLPLSVSKFIKVTFPIFPFNCVLIAIVELEFENLHCSLWILC